MKIIFTGALVSVVGILLPWLSGRVTGSLNIGSQSVTGFELNQGLIGAGIAIIGAVLSYLGSQKQISKKIMGCILIVLSVAIFVVAFSVVNDLGPRTVSAGSLSATVRYRPQFGIFVTLAGSIIIFAGALKMLLSKSE